LFHKSREEIVVSRHPGCLQASFQLIDFQGVLYSISDCAHVISFLTLHREKAGPGDLINRPAFLTDPPASATLRNVDVLSEVLKVVRLEGALFFNGEFSAPWCLSSARSADAARYLSPSAGHLIIYHYLVEGRAYSKLPEGPQEYLAAGDIIVFPHG